MEQTTEQILSKLYSLRAGLSVISEERDKIREVKTQELKDLVSIGGKLKPHFQNIRGLTPLCYGDVGLDESYDNLYKYRKDFKRELSGYTSYFYWFIHIVRDILGEEIKTSANGEWYLSGEQEKQYSRAFLNFCIEFDSETYPDFGFLEVNDYNIKLHPRFTQEHFYTADCSDSRSRLIENFVCTQWLKAGLFKVGLEVELNKERAALFKFLHKKNIARIEHLLSDLPALQEKVKDVETKTPVVVKGIRDTAAVYYNALQAEFNSFIDERDWQYLDLIIYYFETRRADTVKEALHLVDREIQTQRIQQTIIAAAEQICHTISAGFARLQDTMVYCFNSLSAQIAQSTGRISSQLSDLTSAARMNNALQAKANITSEQLVKAVRQIQTAK